jgi:hypothetical protein
MIAMRVVEVTIHQVVRVITMGNPLVPTARPVPMLVVVVVTAMLGRALTGVRRIHLDPVFIHVIPVWMMQVPIVQEIRMAVVTDRGVPTVWSVLVIVTLVDLVTSVLVMCHGSKPPVPD